jgi:hypothetical protein
MVVSVRETFRLSASTSVWVKKATQQAGVVGMLSAPEEIRVHCKFLKKRSLCVLNCFGGGTVMAWAEVIRKLEHFAMFLFIGRPLANAFGVGRWAACPP